MLKRTGHQLFRTSFSTLLLLATLLGTPAAPAALLGVVPGVPLTTYDSGGTTSYNPITQEFQVTAKPVLTFFPALAFVNEPKSVDINIQVDNTGALIGGAPGPDLVMTGDVAGYSGMLLTGEITAFGSKDSGGPTDKFDFRFTVTGGLLAPLFVGLDIGVTLISENSNFTGSFAVDFGGNAKGNIGPIRPQIDIEKFTNGQGADNPNGGNADGDAPQVAIGNNVVWSYRVTNTGGEPLVNIVVTDDQGVAITCSTLPAAEPLAPGDFVDCSASGTSVDLTTTTFTTVPGTCGTFPNTPMYENFGTVNAQSQSGTPVQDTDPSHYCNPQAPSIDIEKFTNGQGADNPNGGNADGDAPQIAIGNTAMWTYKVTNTGNVRLDPVLVTDDQGVSLNCPLTALDPGQMMTCSASGDAVDLNNTTFTTVFGMCGTIPNTPMYENFGTAVGNPVNGQPQVNDTDPSHYCNPQEPSIDIEKFTNGQGADDPNGGNSDGDAPQIAIGNTAMWTYKVTNTGNVRLDPVVVTDDQGVTLSCPEPALDPGQMMTCSASGDAVDLNNTTFTTVPGTCGKIPNSPMYENFGTVVGNPVNGQPPVDDTDPSHYCNPQEPSIDIEKFTNGQGADDPNGNNADGDAPQIAIGNTAMWTYKVTNTGNVRLEPVVVTDDQGVTLSCPEPALDPGQMMTCSASGPAVDLNNTTFTTVFGICGSIPDTPMYENKGTATGTPVNGQPQVNDTDPSHYCNPQQPSIDIEKFTNGQGADSPDGSNADGDAPIIVIGNTVSWTYKVTNTGNVTLDPVVVADDQGVAVDCPMTALNPGQMMLCTASGAADNLATTTFTTVPGLCGKIPQTPMYENQGIATGDPVNGQPQVNDTDPSHYCNPQQPSIDIEKFTNDQGADDPNGGNPDGDAPQIPVGNMVDWEYRVSNTGNVRLDPVVVTDDQGVTVDCPETGLDPGQSMICTASALAEDLLTTTFTTVPGLCGLFPQTPMYENMGLVTGDPVNGQPQVNDDDPSHYCNPQEPSIDIEKFTNGQGADDPNGGNADGDAPRVQVGDLVTWTYRVTNTGNTTLNPVVVVDDSGTPANPADDLSTTNGKIDCPETVLAPAQMMECTASDNALDLFNPPAGLTPVVGVCEHVPNQPLYGNKAVATGSVPGAVVDDSDPSHYCVEPPQCDINVTKTCLVVAPPVNTLPGKCSGKIQEITAIWTGGSAINISGLNNNAPNGVVNQDQEVVFNVAGAGQNDVFLNISGGGYNGESKFHLSCSDDDMNADNDDDAQDQVSPLGRDCGKLQGDAKSNGDPNFINLWQFEGLVDDDGLELDCTAPEPTFPTEAVQCEYQSVPETGGSCSDIKDITALTLLWDGPSNVNLVSETGQVINSIQNGQVIILDTPKDQTGNDVDAVLSGAVNASVKFHISCSDDNMDGPEDCGLYQGNGKDDDSSLNNQWRLGGMTGENGSFGCPAVTGGGIDSTNVIYGFSIENLSNVGVGVTVTDSTLGIGNAELGLQTPQPIPAMSVLEVVSGEFIISPDASNVFTNTVVVEGSTAQGAACEAMDTVNVKRVPPPPTPLLGKCSGKLKEVVVIWNGIDSIEVAPGDGATSVMPGQVNPGDILKVFPDGSTNDVFVNISDAMSGALIGESKFHVSCSDNDMNADNDDDDQQQLAGETQDCGKYQGNAKDSSGFINDWLLEGMLDDDDLRLTCNFDASTVEPGSGGSPGSGGGSIVTGAASLDLGDNKKVKWELTNNGATDVFVTRVVVSWPAEHELVKKFKLAGDFAKDVDDAQSPTAVPDDKDFESDPNKRKLKDGETKKLEIEFSEDFEDHLPSDFTLSVEFDTGQVLTFP